MAGSTYIISNDCTNCAVCVHMCPLEAIVETSRQFAILKRVCDGCGICVPYCPVVAIVPGDTIRERQSLNLAEELRRVLGEEDMGSG